MDDLPLGIKNRRSVTQLVRFGLVSIMVNLVGYMVYLLITYVGGTPKITMTLIYAVAVTASFFGNRKLAFAHKGSFLGAGIRYVIAHCFGYCINLTILIVLVDKLGYAHQWAQASAILVVAAFLFLAFKFFVFRERDVSNIRER